LTVKRHLLQCRLVIAQIETGQRDTRKSPERIEPGQIVRRSQLNLPTLADINLTSFARPQDGVEQTALGADREHGSPGGPTSKYAEPHGDVNPNRI
jgi:hypothetical protein